jgi:hypothetical protein
MWVSKSGGGRRGEGRTEGGFGEEGRGCERYYEVDCLVCTFVEWIVR